MIIKKNSTRKQKEFLILCGEINKQLIDFIGGVRAIDVTNFQDQKVRLKILRYLRRAGWKAEMYSDRDEAVDCIRFGDRL